MSFAVYISNSNSGFWKYPYFVSNVQVLSKKIYHLTLKLSDVIMWTTLNRRNSAYIKLSNSKIFKFSRLLKIFISGFKKDSKLPKTWKWWTLKKSGTRFEQNFISAKSQMENSSSSDRKLQNSESLHKSVALFALKVCVSFEAGQNSEVWRVLWRVNLQFPNIAWFPKKFSLRKLV